MPNSSHTASKRKQLLLTAGQAASIAAQRSGRQITFTETGLEDFLSSYLATRNEFAKHHGVDGLLANHKVAALYIFMITNEPPTTFFDFPPDTPEKEQRVALSIFMVTVMLGVLFIKKDGIPPYLREDLEYCMMKERPSNLEWLCFSMHVLCAFKGNPTNTTKH